MMDELHRLNHIAYHTANFLKKRQLRKCSMYLCKLEQDIPINILKNLIDLIGIIKANPLDKLEFVDKKTFQDSTLESKITIIARVLSGDNEKIDTGILEYYLSNMIGTYDRLYMSYPDFLTIFLFFRLVTMFR